MENIIQFAEVCEINSIWCEQSLFLLKSTSQHLNAKGLFRCKTTKNKTRFTITGRPCLALHPENNMKSSS
jgi:hypothetical protein